MTIQFLVCYSNVYECPDLLSAAALCYVQYVLWPAVVAMLVKNRIFREKCDAEVRRYFTALYYVFLFSCVRQCFCMYSLIVFSGVFDFSDTILQ